MDGVLYRGNDPLRGLSEFIDFLRARPIPFRMATNNSGSTPTQYAAKLAKMGVTVAPEEIMTSGTATAPGWRSAIRQRARPCLRRGFARARDGGAGLRAGG